MREAVVLTPTGCIGNRGIHRETFIRALDEVKPQVLAMDGGSLDPGAYYLGSGQAHSPVHNVNWDLDLLITHAVPRKIPVVVGSAGGSGARGHVDTTSACSGFPQRRHANADARCYFSQAACLLACFLWAGQALAADSSQWPTRPVRLVVPFPPGGGSDVVGRIVAGQLSPRLRQTIVVDNRPGAAAIVGTNIVSNAPADGYTLLLASGSHSINASLRDKLPYDPVAGFAPISRLASIPNVLVVHPALPAASVKELIAHARQNPGQMSYASAGSGSTQHLAMELFKSMASVDFRHIPYKGASPAEIDILAGRVQVMFGTVPATVPHARAGRLRALAVSSLRRTPLLPDVPSVAESGLAGFEVDSWYGLMGPKGTPIDVVRRLNREVKVVLESPEVKERFAATGADAIGSTPEQLLEFVKGEIAKWSSVARKSGIRID